MGSKCTLLINRVNKKHARGNLPRACCMLVFQQTLNNTIVMLFMQLILIFYKPMKTNEKTVRGTLMSTQDSNSGTA